MEVRPEDFLTQNGRRVLNGEGEPVLGSSTQKKQSAVAAAIYANCADLDESQLNEIIGWLNLYKS